MSTAASANAMGCAVLHLAHGLLLLSAFHAAFASALPSSPTPRLSAAPVRTLWVSPTGVDTGSCNAAAPCASITFAFNNRSGPGVVIHVAPGGYGEQTLSAVNGTATAPIVITGSGSSAVCSSITFQHVEHVTVSGVHVHHSPRASVTLLASSHITLSDSEILDSASYGIVGTNVSHLLLLNLTIDRCGDHNIYLGGPTADISLLRSRIYSSKNFGIHLDPYIYHSSASDTAASAPSTHLLRVMIRDNVWSGNGYGDITGAGWTNSSIINNVMYGQNCAIAIGPWVYVPGAAHLLIYHNTMHLRGDKGRSVCFTGLAGPVVLRNNIILSDATSGSSSAVASLSLGSTADLSLLDSDYNLIGNVTAGNETFSLAQWQTRWGQDRHSLDVSLTQPGLEWVKPASFPGADYHLQPGALAINHGTFLAAAPFDFDGRWRGGHSPNVSLGAYEFVDSTLPPAAYPSSRLAAAVRAEAQELHPIAPGDRLPTQ